MSAIVLPAQTLTTLHSFNSLEGSEPDAALIQAADGNLFGTTSYGGVKSPGTGPTSGYGTVFEIATDGQLRTLYRFCSQINCEDGQFPSALVQATDGNFYGTTGSGGANACSNSPDCGTVFKLNPTGALTTIHSFNGTDGETPGSLIQASNGNLYGTTYSGGAYLEARVNSRNAGQSVEILGTDLLAQPVSASV
jgi:uncharacterized repeat protein (TIGR03803 family)